MGTLATLSGGVQDRLEEPRGPGIFWQLQAELYPLLVEAMNAFTLITGEPQYRNIAAPYTIPASTSFAPLPMPPDAIALLRVEGAGSLAYDRCWVIDLDRHYPGWETKTGPVPQIWFPFGLSQFGIYPNLTAPATVILVYIQLAVSTPRPYTGAEAVPFQSEYFDALDDYAAAMARLKEGTLEFQEAIVLFQRFLSKAEELSNFAYRKGSLRFSRSLGVQAGISDARVR